MAVVGGAAGGAARGDLRRHCAARQPWKSRVLPGSLSRKQPEDRPTKTLHNYPNASPCKHDKQSGVKFILLLPFMISKRKGERCARRNRSGRKTYSANSTNLS